jgi:peptidoglycan hydrolase CwlO-like protein
MKNKHLYRMKQNAFNNLDSVLDEMVAEIEDLERENDILQSENESNREEIIELNRELNKLRQL